MVHINISHESYILIRSILACSLEAEMLNGRVLNWDDDNCAKLSALIELDSRAGYSSGSVT